MLLKIFLLLFILSNINANDILSKEQNNILNLSKEQINQNSSKLKKDWINPIYYKYIYSKDEKYGLSKKSILSINQPIFRSGGIYYAIKYANNLQTSSNINLDIQKKNLIVKTLSTVYNIKKLDIQIKQTNLLLQNATIDYKNKKESVFNGLLGSSFLNNSIISLNKIKLSLINLKYNKQNLIDNLSLLSSLKYDKIKLPTLNILSKDEFLKNTLESKKDKLSLKSKDYLKGITNSKYLPSVNINYNKTFAHTNNIKDNYNYGFTINIPLDIRTYNDIQVAKIDVLKQKEQNKINSLKDEIFIKSKLLNLDNIEQKINLTKQTIASYKDLLTQTQELSNAGLKTIDDAVVFKNSLENEKLNIDLFNIDKQLQLLQIYGKITNDKI